MDDHSAETERRRRRFGLKAQLLLLLFTLNLVAAAAYSVVLFNVDRAEIITGIDGRLRTAALAVKEMADAGYHVRVTGPESIPWQEYDRLQYRLSRFAEGADLAYVYTYMQFGREIRTVSTSATAQEVANRTQTRYWTLYDTAPRKLYQSFADGRVRFDEYRDSFGRFRSIYLPVRGLDDRIYVVGADIDLAIVRERTSQALKTSILVGAGMFALSMALGWLLVDRIVQPLARLTLFTRNIGQRNFQPDETEAAAMARISRSRSDEVGSLAEAMTAMIARLQRYLVEMEQATAARERVEGELSAARDIQVGMLPRRFPPFPERTDVDIHALLQSAKEVGGDLYDYVLVDRNRLFFVVGDVSGKGVPAALFMAMTTTLFKATALSAASIGDVIARVNAELSRDNAAQMFVTAFAGVLDLSTGRVDYAVGGHEPPFLRRADGSISRLPRAKGMALGVFEDAEFETAAVTLAPGDALVLFTDGVSEATNADDDLYTIGRIEAALSAARPDTTARGIAQGLADDVRVFVGEAPQSDDVAILVVRWEGATAAAGSSGRSPGSRRAARSP